MYKIKLLLGMFAAACLAACTPLAIISAVTSSPPIAGSTALDEKAWYAAEALYNVPAQAYVSANKNGLLSPAVKAQVKPVLLKAREALLLVRQAYKVGDTVGFGQRFRELQKLSDSAKALLPK